MIDSLKGIDSRDLRKMSLELGNDAKALFGHNKPEAMKLFRLYRRIVTELHRRRNPATFYQWN